jgi:hypothetical protein
MKTVKLVFGLIMVLALISGSAVIAQEVDPTDGELLKSPQLSDPFLERDLVPATQGPIADPEPEPDGGVSASEELPRMEPQPYPVSEILELDITGMPDETDPAVEGLIELHVPSQHNEFIMPEEMEVIPDELARDVGYYGALFSIATTDANENHPTVAHGGNYYMVVYYDGGNIRAKVYTNTGSLYQNFLIRDCSPNFCGYPSVAYEAKSGLFLVAYEYFDGSDYEIYHRAVSPTGPVGTSVYTTPSSNEWWPSVACNSVDGSCLVAHEDMTNDQIEGVWLRLSSTGISDYSGIILLESTTDDVSRPYMAWGKGTGRYMLTYRRYTSSQWRPYYQHLYDVYTTPDQYSHGPAFVVPSTFETGTPTYPTGVTYDPCTQKFAIVFTNEWSSSIFDVWVAYKHPTTATGYGHQDVAYAWAKEHLADISFVTDPHLTPACGRMDKMVVIYKNEDSGRILAADLLGNSSVTYPSYVIDYEYKHTVVATNLALPPFSVYWSVLSSGSKNANLFAAVFANAPLSGGNNVYGRLLKVPDKNFMPLMLR